MCENELVSGRMNMLDNQDSDKKITGIRLVIAGPCL